MKKISKIKQLSLSLLLILSIQTITISQEFSSSQLKEIMKLKELYSKQSNKKEKKVKEKISTPPTKNQNKTDLSKHEQYFNTQLNLPLPPKDIKTLIDTQKKRTLKKNETNETKSNLTETNSTIIKQFGYEYLKKYTPNNIHNSENENYLLGPGDSIKIRFWGGINQEQTYTLDTHNTIYISQLGAIKLQKKTIKAAKWIIKEKLNKKYNNTNLTINLVGHKTITIFILGEVHNPGAYEIKDKSSIINTLYNANGPKKVGSLRNIQIKRKSNKNRVIDLYDFLINGEIKNNITLKENDIIYIPPIKKLASIKGAINREAIYEIDDKTSLYDMVYKYGAGTTIDANTQNFSILREEENQAIAINIKNKSNQVLKNIKIHPGDRVIVHKKTNTLTNAVKVLGEIHSPGIYPLQPNFTLKELIKQCKGFNQNAEKESIEILRRDKKGNYYTIVTNISEENITLQEWDIIRVPNIEESRENVKITLNGAIKKEGSFYLSKDLSLKTALKLTRLHPYADTSNIQILRTKTNGETRLYTINLKEQKPFILKNNDAIFISTIKGYTTAKYVTLDGEIQNPGKYALKQNETIYSLIQRAGGLKKDSFLYGLELYRPKLEKEKSNIYNKIIKEQLNHLYLMSPPLKDPSSFIPLQQASIAYLESLKISQTNRISLHTPKTLKELKTSESNIKLNNGDIIFIPKHPKTIQIAGGVNKPGHYLYTKNKPTKYYIKLAGNTTYFALKRKILVFKANGKIIINPRVIEQGDSIYIEERIKTPPNILKIVTNVTQIIFNLIISGKQAGIINQ
ncbi:MAG: SLBB domain-containing protein [bacterium]